MGDTGIVVQLTKYASAITILTGALPNHYNIAKGVHGYIRVGLQAIGSCVYQGFGAISGTCGGVALHHDVTVTFPHHCISARFGNSHRWEPLLSCGGGVYESFCTNGSTRDVSDGVANAKSVYIGAFAIKTHPGCNIRLVVVNGHISKLLRSGGETGV